MDTSFKTNIGFTEPVNAGELSRAGIDYQSVLSFDQFQDGLKVGYVAFRDKAVVKNMVTGKTTTDFAGVVLRKKGSASIDVYKSISGVTKSDACPVVDDEADVCVAGIVTVVCKAGATYTRGEKVFVQDNGSVDKAGAGVEWVGVTFVDTLKDGVAQISIPSRIS